MDVDAIQRGKS